VPLARRVADALAAAGLPVVTIVARADQPLPCDAPARCDEIAGAGPLGGITAALAWAEEEGRPGAVCVACDLPLIAPGLLRYLARHGASSGARALVPAGGGRWGVEPLCAYYSTAALPAVRRRALRGELQLGPLLQELGAPVVPAATVRRWGDPAVLFLNVNTPDDRRRAERLLG
jgi:molybdopterin-guanine dinucleotide biosynthesis protein A